MTNIFNHIILSYLSAVWLRRPVSIACIYISKLTRTNVGIQCYVCNRHQSQIVEMLGANCEVIHRGLRCSIRCWLSQNVALHPQYFTSNSIPTWPLHYHNVRRHHYHNRIGFHVRSALAKKIFWM